MPAGDARSDATAPAVRNAVEIAIRLGAIALLVASCLMIIAPFVSIVVWALIIAIAADGPFEALCRRLRGRRRLAATLLLLLALVLLIVPAVRLSETLISGAQSFAQDVKDGRLHVPPPDQRVAGWPLVGPRLYDAWTLASENLGAALSQIGPQLQAVSVWLLKAGGSAGVGILQMVGSFLIAGVMLVRSESRTRAIEGFATRMAGPERGARLVQLANATVRSVVNGIVGVAVIQAMMAGLGFAVAGVPGAGLWSLLVLVAAVVQLPVAIVLLPPALYGLSSIGGLGGIVLAVWCIVISLVDNVLKPILFGRGGAEVPTLVIFMGAIGGMLTMGILGLFLGAVVLAVGFTLFTAWLSEGEAAAPEAP